MHSKRRFDEPAQIEGTFWTPDSEDERFFGRVDHDESSTTFHAVNCPLVPSGKDRDDYFHAVLHGISSTGESVTLLGVYVSHFEAASTTANSVDAMVDTVVLGDHIGDLDAIPIRTATFTAHGLREVFGGVWPEAGLLEMHERTGGAGDLMRVELEPGVELEIAIGESHDMQSGRRRPREYANARLLFDGETPFGSLRTTYLDPFCDFLMFSTRRPSYLTALTLTRDERRLDAVTILQTPYPRPSSKSRRHVIALSPNLRHVSEPSAVLASWMELRQRVGAVWPRFFSAVQSTGTLDDQFIAFISFIEGYHRALHDEPPLSPEVEKQSKKSILRSLPDQDARRVYRQAIAYANSQTLRERVEWLAARMLEHIAWDLDVEKFAAQAVHTRNWMAHWGTRGQHALDDTHELLLLVRRMEVLIYVNLLCDLSLASDEIVRAVGSGWRYSGLP